MKQASRILRFILLLSLIIFMLALTSYASAASVKIDGKSLESGVPKQFGDGNALLDAQGNTLTLYDATIVTDSADAIEISGDITIVLKGENSITSGNNDAYSDGIFTTDNLTFSGDGNLTINGGNASADSSYVTAIFSLGDITFAHSGTITANAGAGTKSYGISGKVYVVSGTLNANGATTALLYDNAGNVNLTAGTLLTDTAKNTYSVKSDGTLYNNADKQFYSLLDVLNGQTGINIVVPSSLISINTVFESRTFENGTQITEDLLPQTAEISTTAGTKNVDVLWTLDELKYDPSSPHLQTLLIKGAVVLKSDVGNPNKIDTSISITVTVQAKPITLVSLPSVAPVSVPYGTAAADFGLSETVEIETSIGAKTAFVKWNIPDYDTSITAAQTLTVTGTVTLLEGITNPDGLSLDIPTTVTIRERPTIAFTTQPQSLRVFQGSGSISLTAAAAASDSSSLAWQWFLLDDEGVGNPITDQTTAAFCSPAQWTAVAGVYRLFCRVSLPSGQYADSDTVTLTVHQPISEVAGIRIHTLPDKTYYTVGEQLDIRGLRVLLQYIDGAETLLNAEDFPFFGITPRHSGDAELPHGFPEIHLSCGESTASFAVTVAQPVEKLDVIRPAVLTLDFGSTLEQLLTSLPHTLPVKTDRGETSFPVVWDTAGIVFDPTITTGQTITIHGTMTLPYYIQTRRSGMAMCVEVSITVTIAPKAPPRITAITALQLPAAHTLVAGTTPDLTGLILELRYDDGTVKTLHISSSDQLTALGISLIAPGAEDLKTGENIFIIKSGDAAFSLPLMVVEPTIESMKIVSFPDKRVYFEGEPLNLTGLRLELRYTDGSTAMAVVPRFEELGILVTPEANGALELGTEEVMLSCGDASVSFVIEVGQRRPDFYYPGDPDRNLTRSRSRRSRTRRSAAGILEETVEYGYFWEELSAEERADELLFRLLAAIPGYRDVPAQSWYYDDVTWAWSEGLTESGAYFHPDDAASRGTIAAWLWAQQGWPEANAPAFDDTDAVAAAWVSSAGIAGGYGGGRFGPDDHVTREQLAAMLYRLVAYTGREPSVRGELGRFRDAGRISSWAREPMAWAVGAGILSGRPDGSLDPQGSVTRAEAAAMLRRCVRYYGL